MGRKVGFSLLLVFLVFIGFSLDLKTEKELYLPLVSMAEETCPPVDQLTVPDNTREVIYSYQISVYNLPVIPRVEARTNTSQAGGYIVLSSLNRLLMKARFLCQSSPKHPYSLQLLPGEVHPGPAKAYYIFALRHLII